VKEGYSIVIFPEGTRSYDDTVKRFHKGAFFLAEKLKIDILPLLIHGSGYTISKGDFMLKDAQLTVKFLPRIKPDDISFGANYSERTKKITKYFREQYALLKKEIETPSYFRHRLISNFLYKGPVLEWYMRVKLRLENNYALFNEIIPERGKIFDLGCGYGFMSYMLGYTSPQREITGIDYDENKIAVGVNGFSKPKNVSFIHANALEYEFENADAVLISDLLHYLQPDEQVLLLEKCIRGTNEKGIIVIRDGIKDLGKRHAGTQLSEWFSTRIFGFNKTGEKGLSFLSSELIVNLAEKNNLRLEKIDTARFTSNVVFVLRK
jgi:SAM-dependent methyltransferase